MVTATDLKADNSEARATLVALEAQKKDIRNRWLLSLPALFIIFFAAAFQASLQGLFLLLRL